MWKAECCSPLVLSGPPGPPGPQGPVGATGALPAQYFRARFSAPGDYILDGDVHVLRFDSVSLESSPGLYSGSTGEFSPLSAGVFAYAFQVNSVNRSTANGYKITFYVTTDGSIDPSRSYEVVVPPSSSGVFLGVATTISDITRISPGESLSLSYVVTLYQGREVQGDLFFTLSTSFAIHQTSNVG